MSKSNLDNRLASIYTSGDHKQDHYDKWADTYEKDLIVDMGYVAHREVVNHATRIFKDKEAHVLDMGCGTGLAGEELRNAGYKNIDGADFSEEMLSKARDRSVYSNLIQYDAVSNEPQLVQYDFMISVGLFGFGPPHLEHLPHVMSILKPGHECLITINGKAWIDKKLEPVLEEVLAKNSFELLHLHTIDYITQQNIDAKLLHLKSS